jgi:3-hydroxyisobutyrate dehydrogenase-like beta-hydroxyacid dehydrogenase
VFHHGGSGAGRAMKLVNNLLWVDHNKLLQDALEFSAALGFDRYETAKIIDKRTGGSRVTATYTKPFHDMVAYMLPFMTKEASAAAQAARDAGADLGPLGDVVRAYLK